MRKVKFYTLGCKVNQYETQAIREEFLKNGFKEVSDRKKADIYVINTCTVTACSDRKSRKLIKNVIRSNPKATVVVTGCYAEKDSDKISRIKGVNFIIGNREKNKIVKIVHNSECKGQKSENIQHQNWYLPLKISDFKNHTRAFVKIQDGCDNFCSFCKIPLVRGRTKSRDLQDIMSEMQCLVKNGFKEIVLTGICLGSYGHDLENGLALTDVVEELEKIDGLFRIRLSSIEPWYVNDKLIEKIATSENKLCRHLHLPLQSGDDEILRKMNRKFRIDEYKTLVNKIRRWVPDVSITTDILVGFSGEGDKNFENTLRTVEEISPSRIHIFPYSRREGTPAAKFEGLPQPRIVKERIDRLKKLALRSSIKYRRRFLGREVEVLIESRRNGRFLTGYSDTYIKVLLKGSDDLANKLITVKIVEVKPNYTLGDIH